MFHHKIWLESHEAANKGARKAVQTELENKSPSDFWQYFLSQLPKLFHIFESLKAKRWTSEASTGYAHYCTTQNPSPFLLPKTDSCLSNRDQDL